MDFNINIFDKDLNSLFEKSTKDEIRELIEYMFISSPKREMYELFFSNNEWETIDGSTQSSLIDIWITFEIIAFVQQKWIEETLLSTIMFLDVLDVEWLTILGQITRSCEKHVWAMTKIHIGVYYYNIISICVDNNLLQYMDPKKVVSAETLDDEYNSAVQYKIDMGKYDVYDGYEIGECVEIVMDSYCTNLRKQVLRQLDADFE